MMVGVEAGRLVGEGQAEPHHVLGRFLRKIGGIRTVPSGLDAVAVADRFHGAGLVAVQPSPGVLDGTRRIGVDEVVAVVRVPPRAAAAKYVPGMSRVDVAAKAVGAFTRTIGGVLVQVVVSVAV